MKKTTGTILFMVILIVFSWGIYFILNENIADNRDNSKNSNIAITNTNQSLVTTTEYQTTFFRDDMHAIYLDVPKDWEVNKLDYDMEERISLLDFEIGILDKFSISEGSATVTYYNSGGLSLAEWTNLHFVNDIKREFGEDFIITPFDTGKTSGIEITGTNKLHPLWTPEADNISSYTFFYYLNNDNIYEFELYLPEKYLSDYQADLNVIKNSVYFGEPFDLDEWLTYTNEDLGFSVQYPAIWNVSEQLDQIGGFVGFDEHENLFEGHKVLVSTPNDEAYTSSLAEQTLLENTRISYPRIGDIPAVRIKGEYLESYGFYDYTDSVFVMYEGTKIKMSYQELGFDLQSREYFDQMVRTLRLI